MSRATPRPINRAQEEHRVGQLFSGLMMDITRQMPADPIQFMIDSLTLGPEQAVQVRAVRCLVPGFPSDDSSDGRCHLVLAHTRVAASYATCRVPRHPLSSLWRAEPGDGPAGAQAGAAGKGVPLHRQGRQAVAPVAAGALASACLSLPPARRSQPRNATTRLHGSGAVCRLRPGALSLMRRRTQTATGARR